MAFWDSYNQAYAAGQRTGDAMSNLLAQQRNKQAGAALNKGDFGAARNIFAQSGDLENLQAVQGMETKQATQKQEQAKGYLVNASQALLQVPEAQRKAAYAAQIRPALAQFGMPPELLSQIDGADMSDQALRAFAAALGGKAPEAPKPIEVSAGASLFDPVKKEAIFTAPERPQKPNWQQGTDANGNLVLIDANQYAPGPEGVAQYVGPSGREQPQVPGAQDPLSRIAELAPDATVTSGFRTPERNEAVGGAPNSYHTRGSGQAVDLVPRAGETTAQLARRLQGQGFAEVIDEGDHVHVAWDQPQSGARASGQGQSQGGVRFGSRRDEAPTALPPETGLTPIGNGFYRNKVGQTFQPAKDGVKRLGGPTDAQVDAAGKRLKTVNQLLTLVDAVDQQLLKTRTLGPGGRYVVNQKEMATLDSLTKQLQLAFKNAAELGAITGPDVPFIEAVAPDPRQFKALVQRGEFKPRLQAIARIAGENYRAEVEQFESLGGDPSGLQPLFRSSRSTTPYDRQGRQTPKPAGGEFEVRVVGE